MVAWRLWITTASAAANPMMSQPANTASTKQRPRALTLLPLRLQVYLCLWFCQHSCRQHCMARPLRSPYHLRGTPPRPQPRGRGTDSLPYQMRSWRCLPPCTSLPTPRLLTLLPPTSRNNQFAHFIAYSPRHVACSDRYCYASSQCGAE